MPRGVTFDELLQQKLSPPPIDSRPAGTHGPAGMGAAYGFFFVEGSRSSGSLASASDVAMSAAAQAADGRSGDHPSPWSGPNRGRTHVHTTAGERLHEAFSAPGTGSPQVPTLSLREQQAFDTLAALGAGLSPSFTSIELRSAFRQLARRYHPDRHIGCSDDDKSRLGHDFARARNAYRVLAERFRRLH
jgi:hypothetical protein